MAINLIAGPAKDMPIKSSYYKGGGKGGGGAFGKNSLTDADFEAMLPGYADALLGSGLDPNSKVGTAATPQDIAKAKVRLMMGGLPGYDPNQWAGVRPPSKALQVTVPLKPIQKKAVKISAAIARDMKRMAAAKSGTSTYGGSKSGSGYGPGGYSSSYGSGGYQGGIYGGAGGASIGLGVGGAFKSR